MKTRSPLIAPALAIFLLIACLPAQGAGPVDVILDRGVSREAEAQTRQAIDATMAFFKKTYGLALERKLEIFVVPDKESQIKELRQRYSMPGSDASHSAATFSGIAGGGVIVVNVGQGRGTQDYISTLCHELVHVFQSQESQDSRNGSIKWMTEGVAEALEAQIMAAAGMKGAFNPQKQWAEVLKKAGKIPRLEHLRTYRDWDTEARTYGYPVVYTTAAMAVWNLIQAKGQKPVFAFFRALRNARPEDAFSQAFGIKLSDFEKDFRPY